MFALQNAAPVQLYDEYDCIFGELTDPDTVVEAIRKSKSFETNVGNIEIPVSVFQLRSLECNPMKYIINGHEKSITDEVGISVENTSSLPVRVRWIDNKGRSPATHEWVVHPFSSFEQTTRPGHLFVFSFLLQQTSLEIAPTLFSESNIHESELCLGAYRPKRHLPSGSEHCILITGSDDNSGSSYIIETISFDDTKYDALVIAAASLDEMHKTISRKQCQETINNLFLVVSNILKFPTEEKYRKLRLSNKKIHRTIGAVWAAMDFLRILGFRKVCESCDAINTKNEDSLTSEKVEEEVLVLKDASIEGKTKKMLEQACELLSILQSRMDEHFIPDIAPPTPWQEPVISGTASSSRWNNRGTHFVTAEERWDRAERNASRNRSGRGRRPNPGDAPSSRGNWGR